MPMARNQPLASFVSLKCSQVEFQILSDILDFQQKVSKLRDILRDKNRNDLITIISK